MRRLVLGLLVVLTGVGCDSVGTQNASPQPNPPDSILAGVNLNQLFADPTGAERIAVRQNWEERDFQLPSRYDFSLEASLAGSDGAELNVYAGREPSTGTVLFYGLVRLPLRSPGDVGLRPTLLVLPDGDGVTSYDLLTGEGLPISSSIREEFVYAMMAYRGETLEVGDLTFTSDAVPSAYELDVDDALAFVNHVYGAEILADPDRVGVIGIGRGGGISLLATSRSNPFDLVVDIAGPANFFADSFQQITESVLSGGVSGEFPGLQSIADQVLFPLRDSVSTMEDARLALLGRSASFFVGPPPFIFVAHGNLDIVVNIDQSQSIASIVGTESALFLEVDGADHRSIVSDFEVVSLAAYFLTEYLIDP